MIKGRKIISAIISVSIIAGLLSGCGNKKEVEEDVITTINVSAAELAPEITDEDLGIVRKEPSELMKITGYQSWEGYNFLVMTNEAGKGDTSVTVQIEDEELFNSLYQARLKILVEPSYSSISQDDVMYAAYAKGLRSLGNEFYNISNDNQAIQGNGEDNITDAETAETESVEDVNEESNIETEEPEITDDSGEVQSVDDVLNGGWDDTEEAHEKKEARNALNEAIEEYMQSVSLNRATQILVYALDGELLGEMTPEKLNDYTMAFEITPTPYDGENGTVYISDLEDGVEYEITGAPADETGNHEYMIKNDSKKPVVIYLKSDTNESEEIIFQNYMQTAQSTGWYLIENQHEFTSTDATYIIRVEHKNSDADLAASLPEEKVLVIKELKNEPQTVNSYYSAIVNETDYPVFVTADTGDTLTLDSKQAIGVHKSAYGRLTYEFEGNGQSTQETE